MPAPTPKELNAKLKQRMSEQPNEQAQEPAAAGPDVGQQLLGLVPEAASFLLGGVEGYDKLKSQRAQEAAAAKEAAKAEIERQKDQLDMAIKMGKLNVDQYEAETKRLGLKKEKLGKELTSQQTEALAGHQASLKQLGDIRQVIQQNAGAFGPVSGRLNALNPWDQTSQQINAMTQLAAQNIGKSLEGGKLTDQDIERYKKMLPNMADKPEVALGKIEQLERLIAQRQTSELDTIGRAGYNTSALVPQSVPSTRLLEGRAAGAMAPQEQTAQAAAPQMSPMVTVRGVQYRMNPATGKYERQR